jgi:hypothetical protein
MALNLPETGGTLADFNIGLTAAIALIYPLTAALDLDAALLGTLQATITGLAAQLDIMLSVGLGPFQAELSAQFNAALAATATLTLTIGDPLAALKLAISLVGQLQAALTAALSLPPINLGLSAELSASVALGAALAARLGLLSGAISAAIEVKLAGLKLIAQIIAQINAIVQLVLDTINALVPIEAALTASPFFIMDFDTGGGATLQSIGAEIAAKFAVGLADGGDSIGPTEGAYGLLLVTKLPSAKASLDVIISP